uniref:tRNA wybutosine-synthesizing protein 3 homolog isoform X2 n=1 Tax=Myodes glareolus TaxID=447135 RepID=UPI002020C63B|nr:tRNA wybutosine-synthesizing protein 3 homolog isoform X2 [Myodes glareolus]
MDRGAEFGRWKAQSLSKADLSRKGSVDEDAVAVVELLNSREEFFTTSSCAGRILLLDGSPNDSGVQKQHCCWLLVTHKPCVKEDVMAALQGATSSAVLKFEPFILHVQCRTLQDAQTLHSVAIDSGFRNSGITVGKRGKTMMAVRSTHGLEVPLSHKGKLMVTEEYIEFLLTIANQKMEENKKRIERAQVLLSAMFSPLPSVSASPWSCLQSLSSRAPSTWPPEGSPAKTGDDVWKVCQRPRQECFPSLQTHFQNAC